MLCQESFFSALPKQKKSDSKDKDQEKKAENGTQENGAEEEEPADVPAEDEEEKGDAKMPSEMLGIKIMDLPTRLSGKRQC